MMRTVPSEPCTGAADSSKRSILRLWYEESDEVSPHSDDGGWCALSLAPLTRIRHNGPDSTFRTAQQFFQTLCVMSAFLLLKYCPSSQLAGSGASLRGDEAGARTPDDQVLKDISESPPRRMAECKSLLFVRLRVRELFVPRP